MYIEAFLASRGGSPLTVRVSTVVTSTLVVGYMANMVTKGGTVHLLGNLRRLTQEQPLSFLFLGLFIWQ